MSDAWHDIQKMMEWAKAYPYRVRCIGCSCRLASADKEDGYCKGCYRKLEIELETLREINKMAHPKKHPNALKACEERISLIEQKLGIKNINKEQIAEVI